MDEFDEILRRKLSEPTGIPDSRNVWNKVNSGLHPGVPTYWKTLALVGLLLWLLTMGLWYATNKTDNGNTSNLQTTEIKANVNGNVNTNPTNIILHDTIYNTIYKTKWKIKYISSNTKATNNPEIAIPQIVNAQDTLTKDSQIEDVTYIPTSNADPIKTGILESREKIEPITQIDKLTTSANNNFNKWEAAIYVGQSTYLNYLKQTPDYKPVIESFRYELDVRYRFWKNLGVNIGFTSETASYKADGITEISMDKVPDLISAPYTVQKIKITQKVNTLNTGLNYNFNLKNKWKIFLGTGIDWILSGTQDNEYYYPGGAYNPNLTVPLQKKATLLKSELCYISAGLDLPIYSSWYLSGRFKKHFLIKNSEWLIPDYTGELGTKYYFK